MLIFKSLISQVEFQIALSYPSQKINGRCTRYSQQDIVCKKKTVQILFSLSHLRIKKMVPRMFIFSHLLSATFTNSTILF